MVRAAAAAARQKAANRNPMTTGEIRLAIDAMGGDEGPSMVVPGLAVALVRCPDLAFELLATRAEIERVIAKHPPLAARLDHPPHRCLDPDGRQAEPGAAHGPARVVHVAGAGRGEAGRGLGHGLGRQHRRADGDGAASACAAWRGSTGRRWRRSGRRCAASRSCSTSAPPSASTPATSSPTRFSARRWRGRSSASRSRRSASSTSAWRR